MKKKLAVGIISIIMIFCLTYLFIGNPIVAYHNYQLKQAVPSIGDKETVTLNELVPFAWDTVYTFDPYTSQAEIEAEIGFSSNSIRETVSEGMVQLLFVKGKTVTASVCGYADSLGYRISFHHSVAFEENALFTVDTVSDIIELTKQ